MRPSLLMAALSKAKVGKKSLGAPGGVLARSITTPLLISWALAENPMAVAAAAASSEATRICMARLLMRPGLSGRDAVSCHATQPVAQCSKSYRNTACIARCSRTFL
jgi:hypothetical protein